MRVQEVKKLEKRDSFLRYWLQGTRPQSQIHIQKGKVTLPKAVKSIGQQKHLVDESKASSKRIMHDC